MGCLNVGPVPWGSRARGLTPFHEQCSLLLIAAASAMAPLSQVCSNSRRPWPSLAKRRGRARLSRESAGCCRAPMAPPGWVAARLSQAKQAPLPARQPSRLRSWGCHRLPSSRPLLSRTARPGATGPQPRRAAGGHAGGRGCGGWRRRASGDPRVIGQVGNRAAEQSPRPLRSGPRPGRHGIARCRSIPGWRAARHGQRPILRPRPTPNLALTDLVPGPSRFAQARRSPAAGELRPSCLWTSRVRKAAP